MVSLTPLDRAIAAWREEALQTVTRPETSTIEQRRLSWRFLKQHGAHATANALRSSSSSGPEAA